jgi:hypothetical protein
VKTGIEEFQALLDSRLREAVNIDDLTHKFGH